MAKRLVMVSDLTGNVIPDDEHVTITVVDHPTLERSVRLDVSEAEIKTLSASAADFTVLEVHRQNSAPERIVVELPKFEKLFKVDVDEALQAAEPAEEAAPRRGRGRPKGSTNASVSGAKAKRDPEQLQAIRDWARSNGYEVSDRGRIKQEIEDAYQKAHA